jgi:adenylate cyclase
MRARPFTHKKILCFFMVLACLVGVLIDYGMGTKIDYWLHDSAVVYQQRQTWKYSGIVVLDNDVPARVTRIQALPLFARAVERLVSQGVKGVFLDARVSKEIEGRMPYAVCLENGDVRWSKPGCIVDATNHACSVDYSEAGSAPLKMSAEALARFRIAPYLGIANQATDFLLYGMDAMMFIPDEGLTAEDRLVSKASPISRWLDMSNDHAVFKLISLLVPEKVATLYQKNRLDELCDDGRRCRRLRLSQPLYKISNKSNQLVLPLSQLAACDETIANKTAVLLKNKVAILQTAGPNESTDMMVSPMTAAMFGPQLMTPGAQYIIDELETLLNQDFPRPPIQDIRNLLFVCVAVLSVLIGAYFSQTLLWLTALLVFMIMVSLCFLNHLTQLWPVTAVMAVYFTGAIQVVAIHLISGFRQGNLLAEYLPQQVIDVLMPLKTTESFQHRHCKVVVLMSDLAGYTTVTGLLKRPELVMSLMNDYLGATSIVLQDKYNGILEAYVGDMVCYYWEYEESTENAVYKQALLAAIELALLQKNFFSSVANRYKETLTPDVLKKITSFINAGIGVTAGDAVKGNLGPKDGVKKFSILGDPLNLAARIESLTRLFNAEIIIAGDLAKVVAMEENLAVRRLGAMKVKGRVELAVLYALGIPDDPRFAPENVKAWDEWIAQIEAGFDPTKSCPDVYSKDRKTILNWRNSGVLIENGVWQLHEK